MTAVERIRSADQETLALLIRSSYEVDGAQFLSEAEAPLQLGMLRHPKGHHVPPHHHLKRSLHIEDVQEVLHVVRGRVRADLFDSKGNLARSVELEPQDTILFVGGGHGLEVLEDAKILEVKQGPYEGPEEDKAALGATS